MLGYVFLAVLLSLIWAMILALGLPIWVAAVPTGVGVLALLAVLLVRRLEARKAAQEIEKSLAAQGAAHAQTARPDQRPEIEAMQDEFAKAIGSLKGSRRGKGGSALSVLPWYLIIGPPGGGKSTALRHSGLNFAYQNARGGAVRGVGGTRNCDWWLTNEAVLLDTAGRYTTEDDDHDEWFGFLDTLVKHRPRRPINGLVLAVSVGDLMGTEEEAHHLGTRIRERVDEVMSRLKMNVPVYVLFTKCDLVAGFVEMFNDLTKADRGQVWGFTHSVDEARSDAKELFQERFDELVKQLELRSLVRLGQERRTESRARIYQFPQQFAVLRHNLAEFMGTVFTENAHEENPLLRGCYFTSGTQEGSPIDRLMNAMSEAFGIRGSMRRPPEQTGEAKSYFLRELFSNVIFPDEKLAVRSATELQRQQSMRLAYAGAALAVAVGLTLLPLVSYFRNRAMVVSLRERAEELAKDAPATAPASAVLLKLQGLRAEVDTLVTYARDGAPWSLRLGMYQGDRVLPAARDAYASQLQRTLVKALVQSDAAELRSFADTLESGTVAGRADFVRAFQQLKLYLLLTGPRAEGEPAVDAAAEAFVAGTLKGQGLKRVGSSAELSQAVAAHAQLYARLLGQPSAPLLPRDESLVKRARTALQGLSPAALAVERLAAEVAREEEDLTLTSLLGASASALRSTGRVRAAFTRKGWEDRVRPQLEAGLTAADAWVVGPRTAARRTEETAELSAQALRSEYFQQYIQEWRSFLESVSITRPGNMEEAITLLEQLTQGKPPPLGRLFQAVAYQTRLDEGGAASVIEEVGKGFADKVRATLGKGQGRRLVGAIDRATSRDSEETFLEARDVSEAFAGLTRFGVPPPKAAADAAGGAAQGTPLDTYQEQLEFLRDALHAAQDNSEDRAPLMTRLKTSQVRVKALIATQETGWRPRLEALLWPPLESTSKSSGQALASETSTKWCAAVVAPFEKNLASRYPFNRNGHDAAIADVGEFFRPEAGTVDGFYNTVLKNDVVRSGERYEFSRNLGSMAAGLYRPQVLQFLQRSRDISSALFGPNEKDPRIEFSLHIRPSPKVASIAFTVDGQKVSYSNGPEEWHSFKWPGGGKALGASIWVKSNRGVSETLEQEGEWGLFRLLEQGQLQAAPGQRAFSVTWKIQSLDSEVTIDIRPARGESPFLGTDGAKRPKLLEPFRAPGVVPPRGIGATGPGCPS